jgi:dTDP-4-dehydrorhamnose 3,5-epimerase
METDMIDGVKIKKLKVLSDERGRLMEMLRSDDEIFIKFGQAYMTTAYPGVVKGWHTIKYRQILLLLLKV